MDYAQFKARYQYNPNQPIGEGGFGQVFKALDTQTNTDVAIKRIPIKEEYKKFTLQHEFELVQTFQHPNIIQYLSCERYETDTGLSEFAVLEFCAHGDLEKLLRKRVLSPQEIENFTRGILLGLQYVHRKGTIHRDLKTRNILIAEEKGVLSPKITDFGLGRVVGANLEMTNTAVAVTYAYAAPEQIQGAKIQANVDLWALGVLIYRMVANELPFGGHGSTTTLQEQEVLYRKIVNVDLPPKLHTLPQPYQNIIRRCLVGDIKQRAQTVDELLQLLENPVDEGKTVLVQDPNQTVLVSPNPPQKVDNQPIKTKVAPIEQRTEPAAQPPKQADKQENSRMIWIGGGVLLAVLLGGCIWYMNKPSKADTEIVTPVPDRPKVDTAPADTQKFGTGEPIHPASGVAASDSLKKGSSKTAVTQLNVDSPALAKARPNDSSIITPTKKGGGGTPSVTTKPNGSVNNPKVKPMSKNGTSNPKSGESKNGGTVNTKPKPQPQNPTAQPPIIVPPVNTSEPDRHVYTNEEVENPSFFEEKIIKKQLNEDKAIAKLKFKVNFIISQDGSITGIEFPDDLNRDAAEKDKIEKALRKLHFTEKPRIKGQHRKFRKKIDKPAIGFWGQEKN